MQSIDNDASILARVSQAVAETPPAVETRPTRRRSTRALAWKFPGILGPTHVTTSFGEVPAHLVRVRDRLRTKAHGFLPVLKIEEFKLETEFLDLHPEARPVLVRRGSLGTNLPVRDAWFSPRQPVLSADASGHRVVDAGGLSRSRQAPFSPAGNLAYYIFHLGQAALVKSEGLWISMGE